MILQSYRWHFSMFLVGQNVRLWDPSFSRHPRCQMLVVHPSPDIHDLNFHDAQLLRAPSLTVPTSLLTIPPLPLPCISSPLLSHERRFTMSAKREHKLTCFMAVQARPWRVNTHLRLTQREEPTWIDQCVWCGVVSVWCGVVWCGVVWCGVVWCVCGVVWYVVANCSGCVAGCTGCRGVCSVVNAIAGVWLCCVCPCLFSCFYLFFETCCCVLVCCHLVVFGVA